MLSSRPKVGKIKVERRLFQVARPKVQRKIKSLGPINVQISEKTPDGTYNLALYTKPITGVISKTEGATNVGVLCDYLNVQFKVNGSVYDDIITGTIQ